MRRVLFDSYVLRDVLAVRQPFVVASAQSLNRVTQPQVLGYVSGHAVTSEAVKTVGVEVIVTRNTSDFIASPVPALLPEEFLEMQLE